MKRYITDLFQTKSKKIKRLKKDVFLIEKVRLKSIDIYITILTIQLRICKSESVISQPNNTPILS